MSLNKRGSAAAPLLELRVRILQGGHRCLSCVRCVLSGRGLCDGSINRPYESYRVCVCVCVRVRARMCACVRH